MSKPSRSSLSSKPPAPAVFGTPPPGRAGAQDTAALLRSIDARLERIEARLAQLDPLLDAAPGALAMLGDGFDELARGLGDMDERARALVALLERATRPQTLAQLHAGLDLLESAPGLVAMVGDGFDELSRAAAERGLDLNAVVPQLGRVLEGALRRVADGQLADLLESDLLDPAAVAALGSAARAMAASHDQRDTNARAGLMALWSATREPGVQRTLALTIDFARRFGAELSTAPALNP